MLSDDEKRAVYDLDGEEGLERHEKGENAPMDPFAQMFGGGGRGRQRGPDAQVDMEVTLEDLFNGAQRQARISRNVICPKCRGTGAKDGETIKCKACGGRGVRLVQRQMAPGFVVQMQEACGECGGRGNIPKAACPHCGGTKVRGRARGVWGVGWSLRTSGRRALSGEGGAMERRGVRAARASAPPLRRSHVRSRRSVALPCHRWLRRRCDKVQ